MAPALPRTLPGELLLLPMCMVTVAAGAPSQCQNRAWASSSLSSCLCGWMEGLVCPGRDAAPHAQARFLVRYHHQTTGLRLS